MSSTREKFKKQGIRLGWGRNKVVLEVGREGHKIVCSPPAFRWLSKIIDVVNDIGYVDPILEGEMIDDRERNLRTLRKARRSHSIPVATVQGYSGFERDSRAVDEPEDAECSYPYSLDED